MIIKRSLRPRLVCCHVLFVTSQDDAMKSGVHANVKRGQGIPEFGPDVTAAWCARNGVDLVIRSHQYVREGVKYMHNGRLITVFSARDYFYRPPQHGAGVRKWRSHG